MRAMPIENTCLHRVFFSRAAAHAGKPAIFWGDTEVGSNTIDVHMVALRRKLDSDRPENERLFHTVYGLGYVLREPSGGAQP